MTGGLPVDLILFGMVAAFLVLRLRSVLGRRTGFERPAQPEARPVVPGPRPARPAEAEEAPPAPAHGRIIPDPRSPPGQALARIAAADRSFAPGRFLDGAEGAFRLIVGAFAAGDRRTLQALLADDTYAGFEQAIAAREAAGETQRTEIRGMTEMAIEAADLRGSTADVTVRFVSDQVNLRTAGDGSIVQGSDGVTEIVDLWTFQRDLAASDPTWRLVATANP